METNSKRLMEAMPSFDDFMKLAEEIKKDSLIKMQAENKIKELESDNFKRVMSSEEFYVGGKPVAVSYYENAYKFSGIDGNLLPLRNALAEIQASLDERKSQFEIYKAMHDLFKVLVYQERVLT